MPFDLRNLTEEYAKEHGYRCWMCEHGCKLWDQEKHWEYCKKCKTARPGDKPSEFVLKGKNYMRADIFPAEGIFLEHVSPEGKRFFSKQEMKDYAKKHDLEIGYLE